MADSLTSQKRVAVDERRAAIGLSSVGTINALLAIPERTGLNFHLPPGLGRIIAISE